MQDKPGKPKVRPSVKECHTKMCPFLPLKLLFFYITINIVIYIFNDLQYRITMKNCIKWYVLLIERLLIIYLMDF